MKHIIEFEEQKNGILKRVAFPNFDLHFQNTAGIGANQYDEQFVVLFTLTMAQLKQVS